MARGVRKSKLEQIEDLDSKISILESSKTRKVEEINQKIAALKSEKESLLNAHKAEQMDELQALLDQYNKSPEDLRVLLVEDSQKKG